MADYDPLDAPTFDASNAAQDDDYDPDAAAMAEDPSQTVPTTSLPTSRVASTAPESSRPLTQAGFIVETSDEEDAAEDTQNGMNGVQPDADVSQTQDVSIGSAPTQDTTSAAPSVQQTASLNGSAVLASAPALAVVSPTPVPPVSSTPVAQPTQNGTTVSQPRMAHDKVGQLEDRISDEPRADPNAWLSLVQYYREKDQLENVRKTYDRFLEVFPTSAQIWLEYLNFEQEQDDHARIDALLNRALMKVLNVDLWLFYLNVLRRRHPLINDADGKNRAVITQAFDFALDNVGLDPDAGHLWRDYIEFIKSGPGNITANSNHWQDQQKADLLRKAYHRAVTLPNDDVIRLWREYDAFELGLNNRAAGRKFIQERSPYYMTAKAAKTQLDERLQGLDRKSLPRLPPLPGFEGDIDFGQQIQKWKGWIDWEKTDELVLKDDEDVEGYRKRVNYAYKQATMSLRFFPDIWFEAAGWCFEQGTEAWRKEGEAYLDAGITANPESSLLSLRKADLVEASFRGKGDSDEVVIGNGNKLDTVFERVHKSLYALKKKYQEREEKALADLQTHYDNLAPEEDTAPMQEDDEDDECRQAKPKTREQQKAENIQLIKASTVSLQDTLKRTISYVWVAKLRAFRRIQGQGKPKEAKKGFRGVFAEARPRGSLTSDVYIASALMEHHCYADIAATKIFERGLKLFPTDEFFILAYMEHLISKNDLTNAKAVFETSITKIEKSEAFTKEQQREKCRPLLVHMYRFESNYGDLTAIHRLEKRMSEMYPDEPEMSRFAQRFQLTSFDGSRQLLAISPIQTQPKGLMPVATGPTAQPVPSVEDARASPQPGQILLGPHGPYVASPKRPLDDSDDGTPSRKFLRGESPLKGAAGRRIATATGAATTIPSGTGGFVTKSYVPGGAAPVAAPQPLSPALNYFLSGLPPAASYQATRFDPQRMVELFRGVDLTKALLY